MVYINSSDEYNIYFINKNITDLKAIPKFWLDHEKEMKYFMFDLSYARETTRMFFFLIEFVVIRCSPGFQFCNENALRLLIRAATIDNIAK